MNALNRRLTKFSSSVLLLKRQLVINRNKPVKSISPDLLIFLVAIVWLLILNPINPVSLPLIISTTKTQYKICVYNIQLFRNCCDANTTIQIIQYNFVDRFEFSHSRLKKIKTNTNKMSLGDKIRENE